LDFYGGLFLHLIQIDMKNFKQELIKTFEYHSLKLQDIKCAAVSKSVYTHIGFDNNDDEIQDEQNFEFQLKVFQTRHKFDLWLNSLDFNYEMNVIEEDDTRSEEQYFIDENIQISLHGTIWLHNGDWLEWDYDEEYIYKSWHLHKIKHIPSNLLQ
jgi:hypothetical protein